MQLEVQMVRNRNRVSDTLADACTAIDQTLGDERLRG